MSIIQSVERLNRRKGGERRNSPLLLFPVCLLQLRHGSSPIPELGITLLVTLVLTQIELLHWLS